MTGQERKKTGSLILHPFFCAAYPVLFLLSYNIGQISPVQAVRPLLITSLLALLLTLLLGASTRNYQQGALAASIMLVLFFTYGHAYHWLEEELPQFANHLLLGVAWLILLTAGITLKWMIQNLERATTYLNIITGALLIQPIVIISVFILRSGFTAEIAPPSPFDNAGPITQADNETPDIYYIVLDAYARQDIVQELYGYDNTSFIDYLKEKGFYVAEASHSNYIQTSLSLASSMNLNYIGDLEGQTLQSEDREPLAELIHHSELRRALEAQGYQTVTFATGYDPTTITDSDVYIPYKPKIVNDLEGLLLTTSATRALGDRMQNLFNPFLCDVQRGGILNIFDNLKKVPDLPGPKFVFAHVSSPHPPFVFDADGNPVQHGDCNGFDGTLFQGTTEDYRIGYPQQMAYISKQAEETIDAILNKSDVPPVIIIQGDHGSGLLLDWNSSENSCLRERTSILNAYLIPGADDGALYDSITPANSFRVVLNQVFKTQLPLLDDQSYYSTWDEPYKFENVTQRLETSCKIPAP